jgi:hypothetical protein
VVLLKFCIKWTVVSFFTTAADLFIGFPVQTAKKIISQ